MIGPSGPVVEQLVRVEDGDGDEVDGVREVVGQLLHRTARIGEAGEPCDEREALRHVGRRRGELVQILGLTHPSSVPARAPAPGRAGTAPSGRPSAHATGAAYHSLMPIPSLTLASDSPADLDADVLVLAVRGGDGTPSSLPDGADAAALGLDGLDLAALGAGGGRGRPGPAARGERGAGADARARGAGRHRGRRTPRRGGGGGAPPGRHRPRGPRAARGRRGRGAGRARGRSARRLRVHRLPPLDARQAEGPGPAGDGGGRPRTTTRSSARGRWPRRGGAR